MSRKNLKRQIRRIIKEQVGVNYVMHPDSYIDGARRVLTSDQFASLDMTRARSVAQDAAEMLADEHPEDHGFGSSDRTYEIKSFLKALGFKAEFGGDGTLVVTESAIKSRLRRIIKEQFGADKEVLSPLVQFSQAWSGLGNAVQEQMIDVVNGYVENNEEAVYEINPNALDTAMRKLKGPLMDMGGMEADEVLAAFDWAQQIFEQGDSEVEADAAAAGDER